MHNVLYTLYCLRPHHASSVLSRLLLQHAVTAPVTIDDYGTFRLPTLMSNRTIHIPDDGVAAQDGAYVCGAATV